MGNSEQRVGEKRLWMDIFGWYGMNPPPRDQLVQHQLGSPLGHTRQVYGQSIQPAVANYGFQVCVLSIGPLRPFEKTGMFIASQCMTSVNLFIVS